MSSLNLITELLTEIAEEVIDEKKFDTDTFRGQLYFYTLHPERYDNIYPIRNKWTAKDYEDFMDFLDYDYLVKSNDYGYVWNEDLEIIEEIKEEIIEEYKSL